MIRCKKIIFELNLTCSALTKPFKKMSENLQRNRTLHTKAIFPSKGRRHKKDTTLHSFILSINRWRMLSMQHAYHLRNLELNLFSRSAIFHRKCTFESAINLRNALKYHLPFTIQPIEIPSTFPPSETVCSRNSMLAQEYSYMISRKSIAADGTVQGEHYKYWLKTFIEIDM